MNEKIDVLILVCVEVSMWVTTNKGGKYGNILS